MKRTLAVMALLFLAGCATAPGSPGQAPVPSTTTPAPPPGKPTQLGEPGPLPAPPLLQQTAEGFQIEAQAGDLSSPVWAGLSRLLLHWIPSPDALNPTVLMADLDQGRITPLGSGGVQPGLIQLETGRALLMGQDKGGGLTIMLADLGTGESETVLAADQAAPQWTGVDSGISSKMTPYNTSIVWIDRHRFVLTLTPPERSLAHWGRLYLGDVQTKKVSPLALEGELAASLPDSTLLIRRGWVDGEMQLLRTQGAEPPQTLAPSGPWRRGWATSPDGRRVAWLEMAAPPGDWSTRLPAPCCSGDPIPRVQAIAVWDRTDGSVRRLPADGLHWSQNLRWSRDGAALLATGYSQEHSGTTNLLRLALTGEKTVLANHEWRGSLTVVAQGADGSVWYLITGSKSQNWTMLIRRHPSGKQEVLMEGIPSNWRVDDLGRLIIHEGQETTFRDLETGRTIRLPERVSLSPDGRFAIRESSPGNLQRLRIDKLAGAGW